MRFGLKNSFFKIFAAAVFGILPQTGAEAYNLAPQSFENFYAVAAEGDLQGLKNMQRRGLNMDATNQNGDTAVCVAVKKQDYLAYKTLIRAGAKSHPACLEKIPEYAHKSFLANYNQKYAAPETPTNWTKNGTALVIGGGIAAGVVALVGVGGGGSGGGHSDEVTDAKACDLNPCAPGCYQNTVCAAGFECTQYESKCNLGCIKCEQKPECLNARECAPGCYVDLTCQEGYECSSRNRCGGCESCRQKTECQKNQCAAGCFRNLNCGSDKTCTLQNGCGGCEKCELVDPDKPDTSNARHCLVYDHSINYCTTCRDGYVSINGTCKLAAPDNCKTYSYNTEKCTECDDGYKLESEGRKCTKDGSSSTTCDAANYPLQSCPANAQTCDNCTPTGATSPIYKINTCKTGYTLSSDKKSCNAIPAGTCTAANYPLTTKPANATSESCVDGSTTRYKITSCDQGYNLSSDKKSCTKDNSGGGSTDPTCDETNFPATECPLFATCKRCIIGSSTRYKILKCNGSDVVINDGKDCGSIDAICTAENFPLSKCPDNANCQDCMMDNGNVRRTRIISCNIGYSLNSDKTACWQQCNKSEYKLSYCPFNAKCTSCTPNGDTTQTSYKIVACDTGLKVNEDGTACEMIDAEECTAEAYPLTSCPGHGSCTSCYGYLDDYDGPRYKLDRCFTGYTMTENKDNCVQTPEDRLCNDTNYPLSYCPYGANCNSCMQKDNPKYQIYSCIMDYSLSADGLYCIHNESGTCTAESYPFTACPANMNCDSCRDSTNIMRYKTFACVSGYKLSEDLKSCVADETQNCDSQIYPFTSCPDGAYCNYCQDSHGTRSNIAKCWFDYTLSEDGMSCQYSGSDECNETNYPIQWSSGCPHGAWCQECFREGGGAFLRIVHCDSGMISPDGRYCVSSGSASCTTTNYPLASCPKYAECNECISQGTTLYKISRCDEDISKISSDGLSCEYKGCGSDYKLSSCPPNATCDDCSDDSGKHYKFKSCIGGYERDGLNEACVASELEPMNNDIANDTQLNINSGNATEYISKNKITYAVGFTNYGKDENANIYNAKTTDASITIKKANELGDEVIAFGSMTSTQADAVNAYDGHTGTITVSSEGQERLFGLATRNNGYNSYKANGSIKITNLGTGTLARGMLSFSDNAGTLYNAFGGKGDIHIESNGTRPWFSDVYYSTMGMAGYNVINAFNGGDGNIYIKSSGVFYGIASNTIGSSSYDQYGFVANAYSTDGSKTVGKITLESHTYDETTGSGTGLSGGKSMYNAYGSGAEGYITINGSGTSIAGGYADNIANAALGGIGHITINGSGTGIGHGHNAISHGTGYIEINGNGTGVSNGSNGSEDGGVGHITINHTNAGTESAGIYGGINYQNDTITITSAEDSTSNLYGIEGSGINYGKIDIKLTGSAQAYGIYANSIRKEFVNGEIGIITITREYTANSSDEVSSNTYGMSNTSSNIYNSQSYGISLINKGVITVTGPTNPAANQKDYIFGMYLDTIQYDYEKNDIPQMSNYGTIKVSGGTNRYGMYNGHFKDLDGGTGYNLSYNYGTVYGNVFNVHNAVGGKIYGNMEVGSRLYGVLENNPQSTNGYNIGVIYNGDAEHIATSADDQDKGYIEYTLTKDDDFALYTYSKYGNHYTAFINYGVINVYNNTLNGTASYINGYYSRNYGIIKVTNKLDNASITGMSTVGDGSASLYNHGTLELAAENTNNLKMIGMTAVSTVSTIENLGHIKIDMGTSTNSTAYGIYSDKERGFIGTKEGSDITITSTNNGTAYGIYADNANIKNHGNITLTGVNPDTSYGIYAVNGSKVYNKGTITINGSSYSDNAANGHFIYIDESSEFTTDGDTYFPESFDTAALGGGKFVLGKDGKITAPEIKGDITADAGITAGGFDKTYSNKNAFSGKTDEVKLNSGSALFDATLKDNDLVMTMKDFDEVVDDKSLAAYLQRNYEAKRNEQLFNSLKFHATSAGLNSSLNQQLGFSLLPNFAQENMNVFRSLSNLVTDTMFAQDLTNERMMVGYDYLGQDRSTKGRVTGYENTANSSYFLADTKLNNRQRFGLGVALTRFNSDYDDDSTRKATFAQALGSYMHDFGNRWKYAGLLRVGYADGDYKRQSDNERVSGDTSDILYGFNNELRYNYDLGFMTLEPQVELNAYGYYQRKIKENDEKISAILVDGTNNLSIEAGAGLYAGKETVYGETGRVKARLGGSYYRELSQPYHTMRARVRDTDGYYLIESTDIFDRNRVIVRADITFSWKALDFYLRGSQFMEDKHTTVINAGIKFNF